MFWVGVDELVVGAAEVGAGVGADELGGVYVEEPVVAGGMVFVCVGGGGAGRLGAGAPGEAEGGAGGGGGMVAVGVGEPVVGPFCWDCWFCPPISSTTATMITSADNGRADDRPAADRTTVCCRWRFGRIKVPTTGLDEPSNARPRDKGRMVR